MSDSISALYEDMDEYIALCKHYNEKVHMHYIKNRESVPDTYGEHAKKLRERIKNENKSMTNKTLQYPYIFDERIITEFETRFGFDLSSHLLMACYVGSLSHGTNLNENSLDDVDMMAIIVPPISRVIGTNEWTHGVIQKDELDITLYSAKKFMGLLMKANPNVVGTLFLTEDMYMYRHKMWFKQFMPNRSMFSTKKAYSSFCGYAQAQMSRLQKGVYNGYMGEERKKLVDKYGYDIKNGAHLVRLYRMGIEYLQTGELQVFRPDREELKSIKRGEWSLQQILDEAKRLEAKMKEVKNLSILPEEVDHQLADQILVTTYKTFFKEENEQQS